MSLSSSLLVSLLVKSTRIRARVVMFEVPYFFLSALLLFGDFLFSCVGVGLCGALCFGVLVDRFGSVTFSFRFVSCCGWGVYFFFSTLLFC